MHCFKFSINGVTLRRSHIRKRKLPYPWLRINETLDELSELARHRCNAHDLSHVLCCMDICSRLDPVFGYGIPLTWY
nr:MAG TPA: hypothetical protein [Caudoviricetes sp.]